MNMEQNDWIDVDDWVPGDESLVLVHLPDEEGEDAVWLGYYDTASQCWRTDQGFRKVISHWQPLPSRPEGWK